MRRRSRLAAGPVMRLIDSIGILVVALSGFERVQWPRDCARVCACKKRRGCGAGRGGTRRRDWCWFVHRETIVLFFSLPQAPKRCWRALLEDEPTRKGLRLPVRHAPSTAALHLCAPVILASPQWLTRTCARACAFPSSKRSNGAVNVSLAAEWVSLSVAIGSPIQWRHTH